MKKLWTIGLLCALLIVFCGAPPEGTETETEVKTDSEVAYGTLTEVELQRFMKAFPVAKAEIEESGKDFKGDAENWEGWIGQFATVNKEIAGLDAKLAAAGMPWNEFWPAFAKTWMASIALMLEKEMGEMDEGMAEIEEQLKNPNIPEAQKEMMQNAMKAMQEVKKISEKVPKANRDIVKKHWDELSKLFEIED